MADPTEAGSAPQASSNGLPGLDADDLLRHLSRRVPLLSREDEQALARRIERGDAHARQLFIEANIRLVVAIARGFQRQGVPLSDLIQEGIIGLIQAVDLFDWRKGTRFSTWATLWIRQAICRALPSLSHTIRIPPRVVKEAGRYEGLVESLAQQLQRSPTPEEVEAQVADALEALDDIRKLPIEPLSLDLGVEDDKRSYLDGLADPSDHGPERRTVDALTERTLLAAFECLNERERQVLVLRFGLGRTREHTLGEIGDTLKLSRQRVKQIEGSALSKLRRQVAQQRQEPRWVGR